NRRRGTRAGRRRVPERGLPPQQERYLQRQGRRARPPDSRPGGGHRAGARGHGRRRPPEVRMVNEEAEAHLGKFKASGAELVMGEARFTEPKTVQVTLSGSGMRSLRGERVFINVGTRASIPDVPGLAAAAPMTHVEALNLERLPEHLVVLGGGYVGLEFAQALRRFGSHVTIIQHGQRLLDREDPDVSDALLELMKDE